MSLQRLDIYNVRNIQEQSILPAQTFNFIYGKNASGKSALIEAIYLLGRAKSFRAASIKSVITFSQTNLIVSADVLKEKQRTVHMGIQMDGNDTEIRINHLPNQKRINLAYSLPLQIIHPKSFELLDASSKVRREFLDWGIFNHDEQFLDSWRKYKQALLQRNALLKLKSISQLNVWNNELVNYGTIVNDYRVLYLNSLKAVLAKSIEYFLNLKAFDINLLSGWSVHKTLQQELDDDLEKDLRYGFTHSGPHRGDFQLLIDRKLAKDVVSRGQLKLLILCLKLAQVELIIKERNSFGCILIDDFAAELDRENRFKVLKYLYDIQCQVFITTTELEDFGDLSFIENYKLFHVEHGEIELKNVPHGTST
jgi:DNA replication and repair protein RecF